MALAPRSAHGTWTRCWTSSTRSTQTTAGARRACRGVRLKTVSPRSPSDHPGSSARYDDSVSAQPAEREDPLDPQLILDQLPMDERGFFLDQYQDAVDNARDPAGWKQLRRVLLRWRFHADAVGDPAYREALDAARGPVGG